jgi:Asp-tRNA(Asn)/Glu-tRNA(Gln) amidotransferase A subunit family amidase
MARTSDRAIIERAGWELARDVKAGLVTARAVTEAFIKRVDEINPSLAAFTHLNHDYWRQQADAVDSGSRTGVLAGVPIGIKDIFNTEVFPTEMGSPIWRGHKAGNDARCVSYLRREGGVLAGKTDTAEFAVHSPNLVKSPWDRTLVTGTSSGGSAVAVAMGMVPLALGTQTAGSTIRPASWCGVYAMKPSFGLIPRTGVLKTTDTLDNIGFFGRDIRDLESLLDVLRVRGENYPGREDLLDTRGRANSPWRVGFVRGPFWDRTDPETRTKMEEFAALLDRHDDFSVRSIEIPGAADASALHRRVYNPCLAYYFRDEIERAPEKISRSFMSLVEDGRTIPPEDYRRALAEQERLAAGIDELMSSCDVLIHQSSNGPAPMGQEPAQHLDLNALWTLAWTPVINVPQFRSAAGIPFGVQLIGRRYADYSLFRFAAALIRAGIVDEHAGAVQAPQYC